MAVRIKERMEQTGPARVEVVKVKAHTSMADVERGGTLDALPDSPSCHERG